MRNRGLAGAKIIFLLLLGLTLSVGFQNCSGNLVFHKEENLASKNQTGDDGRPYEGKIYVLFGDVCIDGTSLRSRIVVMSSTEGRLERVDCNEITPVALGPSDFQINSQNGSELIYQNQVYTNTLVGKKLDMSLAHSDSGFAWMIDGVLGPTPDTSELPFQSMVQIYEDGKPLGPAHSGHPDIRAIGLGRFSHRAGLSPAGILLEALRWSASDNSDPRTNGRTYTWDVRQ